MSKHKKLIKRMRGIPLGQYFDNGEDVGRLLRIAADAIEERMDYTDERGINWYWTQQNDRKSY